MESQCRICLEVSENMLDLFDNTDLVHKIETISSLNITPNDNFPTKVCEVCVENTHILFDFRSIIIKSTAVLYSRFGINNGNLQVKDEDPQVYLNELNLENDEDLKEVSDVCFEEIDNLSEDFKSEQRSELSKKGKRDTVYRCQFCDFICTALREWTNHRNSHSNVMCSICGKELRRTSLKVHMRIHVDSPVFCNICGKTAKNPESLRNHMIAHKDIKYQCKVCGNIYKYPSGYRSHIRRHLPGYTKKEACKICGKLFHEKRFLAKHLRSHTGEKPYKCEYCENGFSSTYALKTHIRRHTNQKPYRCEYCGLTFNQNVSLRSHLHSKHLKHEVKSK